MTVRWSNIAAAALFLFAMVLLIANWREIEAFVGSVRSIGPNGTTEERVTGLIAFGVILVSLLGLVRILSSRGGQS